MEGRDAQKRDARARWVMGLSYWALRRHMSRENEVPCWKDKALQLRELVELERKDLEMGAGTAPRAWGSGRDSWLPEEV